MLRANESVASLWTVFRIVFGKEMRELRRDRKTLFWLLAPPIILPAIALVAAVFIGTQTAHLVTTGFAVTVVNSGAAPSLLAKLKASPALIVDEAASADAAGTKSITLIVPDGFQAALDAGQPVHLQLIQHDTSFASTLALGAVRSEVAAYNDSVLTARLASLGHDRNWLAPVTLDETQAATSVASASTSGVTGGNAANAGIGAIFLPLALTSWLIGGGLGLIVDTTVGEKERQTIEALLVTPASRIGMVIGKLAAVMVVSLIVMGLWLIEGVFLSVVVQAGPQLLAAQGMSASAAISLIAQSGLSIGGLIGVLLLLFVPFVIVLNGLVMAFCSVASSYRESNGFLFLLQLAVPALVLISIFSINPDAGLGWYAAPVMGTILSIRDLFSQTLTSGKLAVSVISTSVYAVAAIGLVVYVYSRDWALSRR